MKAVACLVRQTVSAWIVSIGDLSPLVMTAADTSPGSLAQSVANYLEGAQPKYGACHDNIVLCPESRSALFATSPIPHALKAQDRQQLKFQAESLLPLDAEQMAADFVIVGKELRVLAIDREEWQPIIDAFAARNLHFRWIAPVAVLAIEEASRSLGDARVVIWEDGGACELWQLDAAGIARWTHLAHPPNDRLSAMRLFAAQAPGVRTWTAINCSSDTHVQLGQLNGIEVRAIERDPLAVYAAAAADRFCQSSFEAWFDLRDGALAGGDRYRALYGWLRAAAAAVAGLLLATTAACYWKSAQADRQLANIQAAHEELFRAAFPGQRIPILISKTIVNEHAKLQGETNGKGELEPVPSALKLLHATLLALATDDVAKVRATNLSILNGLLDVDLTFDSEKDARVIANRLKEVGIDTGPLGTTQDKNGKWNAIFKGKLISLATVAPHPWSLRGFVSWLPPRNLTAALQRTFESADRLRIEELR